MLKVDSRRGSPGEGVVPDLQPKCRSSICYRLPTDINTPTNTVPIQGTDLPWNSRIHFSLLATPLRKDAQV